MTSTVLRNVGQTEPEAPPTSAQILRIIRDELQNHTGMTFHFCSNPVWHSHKAENAATGSLDGVSLAVFVGISGCAMARY